MGTPVWLSVLLAGLTLAGVLASALFLRKTGREARVSAGELDRRGKREETMRTLRWAAERAVSSDYREGGVGLAVLGSLGRSPWLEAEDQAIIDAVTAALRGPATNEYRQQGGGPVYEDPQADEEATGG